MSQSELSQKALAFKAASKSATHPVGGYEQKDASLPKATASPAAPLGPRGPPEVRTILRMPQVAAATGLKASHIYDLISQGGNSRAA